MRAGQLRHRVTIQRFTVMSQNSLGEDVGSWTDIGTYWAEVRAMQGRELERGRQTWAEARWQIRMRVQPEVTIQRKDHAVWGSRTLDILDAEDPVGRAREWRLICRELTS